MHNDTFINLRVGLFPEQLDPERLQRILAEQSVHGWQLIQTIKEQHRLWLFFSLEENEVDFFDDEVA